MSFVSDQMKMFFFISCLFVHLHTACLSKVLRFQHGRAGAYSTSEWAELKGPLPHLSAFTVCHWERLAFFSVRDSCQWAACYKLSADPADHHCTQFWYNRDAASGGRYVRSSGGFGDNSYGGKLVFLVLFLLSLIQKY